MHSANSEGNPAASARQGRQRSGHGAGKGMLGALEDRAEVDGLRNRWAVALERERRLALKSGTEQASYVWLRWEAGMGESSDGRMVPGRLSCG